jgi:hypothetical protein
MSRSLAILCALVGCVDHGPGPQGKKIEASYVAEHLVAAVPADVTRVDIALGAGPESGPERSMTRGGGKVTYVGNRTDRPMAAPGQTLRITHYWQVTQPVGDGWRVFALLRGAPGTADFMNLPASDMEIGHPPATWKAGEIIEDIQDIPLRPDWHSAKATLYVGMIHVGGHDTGDRMVATGPRVVDRAVVARELDVDLSRAPPPPGTVYLPRAGGAIAIDGVASDPGWTTAVTSPEFAIAEGCPEPLGKATARMTWDDQYLYVFASIVDPDIVSQYTQHDDPLYRQDAVEIFIDADSNRRGYVELQVNPNNATFDSWFPGTKTPKGDEAWDSGMVTAVKLRGTSAPGDSDQGWDAEIAIPWSAVKGRDEAMAVRLPPQVGDRWRMNVVRVDIKSGGAPFSGGATSWNRITCADFHALDRMLTVVFADRAGSIIPQPAGSDAAGSAAGTAAATGSGSAAGAATGSGSAAGAATGSGSAAGAGVGLRPSVAPSAPLAPRMMVAPRVQGAGSATP